MNLDGARTICVTGASGYIGSHVVSLLLQLGHVVHAVVRDPRSHEKVTHLQKLPGAERLKLVKGDVLDAAAWDGILAPADGLIHCAAAVTFAARDPQKEIVDVAVMGTENVLGAAVRSEKMRSIVHVSSIAALLSYGRPEEYLFSSKDWCEDATLGTNPYALGKALSEKAAWRIHEESQARSPAASRSLAVVAPGYVFGPLLTREHARSSPVIVQDILRRAYPGCPSLNFNLVDVRDVAKACVALLGASGERQRVVMVNERRWWQQIAIELDQMFPSAKVRTGKLPNWLLYVSALFEARVSFAFLKRNLGRELRILDSAEEALGLKYYSIEQTLRDTAESLFALSVVPRR